jgi:Flp pilus assembly protein TadG
MSQVARSPRSRVAAGLGLRRVRRLFSSERGTALVEFALIAPFLFALVFMIIDFGRALNYYNDLTQLAGQGARAAVVNRNPDETAVGTDVNCPSATGESIQCQIATTYPSDSELKDGISVCLGTLQSDNSIATTTSPNIGDPVTVRTTFKFQFIPFLTDWFHFGTITLRATQTERLEAQRTWQEGSVSGPSSDPTANACLKPS